MSDSPNNEFKNWKKNGDHEVALRLSNWENVRQIFNFESYTLNVVREKTVAVLPFNQLDRVAVDHARRVLEQLGGSDPHQAHQSGNARRRQGRSVRSL